MELSKFLDTVETLHAEGRDRGLFFQTVDDVALHGRTLHIHGKPVCSWASCSYLGLELHPALRQGAHDAIDRYGTQFSSSRGYISSPQYEELEELLGRIFGGHVVVTPTTTLGHQAVLGSILTEDDAIVFDHQVHASVQVAAALAKAKGVEVHMVRHGEHAAVKAKVVELAKTARTVWVMVDGVYSMYGDLAPVPEIKELLAIGENVRLYVDDAHGMSWAGRHGRGSFLSRMPLSRQVVVATSFAKAFGAGGACVVFADRADADRVRMCGGPMLFSGPLQPPTLGALIASAKLHLTDEIVGLQQRLKALVKHMNDAIEAAGLPLLVRNSSPIIFIPVGVPQVAMEVAGRVLEDGHLVNVSMYPSVPQKRSGLRIAVTTLHSEADIDALVASLSRHIPAVFDDLDLTRDDVASMFDGAAYQEIPTTALSWASPDPNTWSRLRLEIDPTTLRVEHYTTIRDVDRALWDSRLGGTAHCSWDAQDAVERVFRDQPKPEHNWEFHYYVVRTQAGEPVAVTFASVSLVKDDMFSREDVSAEVERRRKADPHFLSSKVVMLGSGLSEGSHLWLDRAGPWRAAVYRVLEQIDMLSDRSGATGVMLRDFDPGDKELGDLFHAQGFVKMDTLPTHDVPVTWRDDAGMVAGASRRMRKHSTDLFQQDARFVVQVARGGTPEAASLDAARLHRLYLNVAEKKLKLNMFFLPDDLIAGLTASPAWEFVVVSLRDKPEEGPIAMYVAHVYGEHYAPLIVGLNYEYVFSEKTYRYLLLFGLRRAGALGLSVCHMGMDAEAEKMRLGATKHDTCSWIQVHDSYHGAVMDQIVSQVALAGPTDRKGG